MDWHDFCHQKITLKVLTRRLTLFVFSPKQTNWGVLAGTPSEMVSKVGVSDGAVLNKSRNIAPERLDALKYRSCASNQTIWNSPVDAPDPADPTEVVAGAAARTPLRTRRRPGWRELNKLTQINGMKKIDEQTHTDTNTHMRAWMYTHICKRTTISFQK